MAACRVIGCDDKCVRFVAGQQSSVVCMCGHKLNQHDALPTAVSPQAVKVKITPHPHEAEWRALLVGKLTNCSKDVVQDQLQNEVQGLFTTWAGEWLSSQPGATKRDIMANFKTFLGVKGHVLRQSCIKKLDTAVDKFDPTEKKKGQKKATVKKESKKPVAAEKEAEKVSKKRKKASNEAPELAFDSEAEDADHDDDAADEDTEDRTNKPWTEAEIDHTLIYMQRVTDNKVFSSRNRTEMGAKALELAHENNQLLGRVLGSAIEKCESRVREHYTETVSALNKHKLKRVPELPSGSGAEEIAAHELAVQTHEAAEEEIINTKMGKYSSNWETCKQVWDHTLVGQTLFSPINAGNQESITQKRKKARQTQLDARQELKDKNDADVLSAAMSQGLTGLMQALDKPKSASELNIEQGLASALAAVAESMKPSRAQQQPAQTRATLVAQLVPKVKAQFHGPDHVGDLGRLFLKLPTLNVDTLEVLLQYIQMADVMGEDVVRQFFLQECK
jgi:hypothetical protein